MKNKKENQVLYGRRPINSSERNRSFSRRASKGELEVIDKKCKYCHHNKMFLNNSVNGRYGRMKCQYENKMKTGEVKTITEEEVEKWCEGTL